MSVWNHACCGDCWFTKFPEKAAQGPPCRVRDAAETTCCFCGGKTIAGIFVRGDPKTVPCGGTVGQEHEDE